MHRLTFVVLILVSLACAAAQAETVTLTVPNVEIPYNATSSSFTVTALFTGDNGDPVEAIAYALRLELAPDGGASGVMFNGASGAASDYVFSSSAGWVTYTDTDFQIYGDDTADSAESFADGLVKNTATVDLSAALTAANVGDTYTVDFSGIDVFTAVWNEDWGTIDLVTVPGTITVAIPEPHSVLLLLAGLMIAVPCLGRRRR